MRQKTLTILLLIMALLASPQAQSTAQMRQQIAAAAQKMQSMECDFTQTKRSKMLSDKMVATGKMTYQRANKLRWEYTKPYKFVIVMNGQKVMMGNGKQNNVINTADNQMLREVARIMIGTMTGTSITGQKDFKVALKAKGSEWTATLKPVRKDMRQAVSDIILTYDAHRHVVTRVVLTDAGGGTIDIKFSNIKVNGTVSATTFAIK